MTKEVYTRIYLTGVSALEEHATCPFCGETAKGVWLGNKYLVSTDSCNHFKGYREGGILPRAYFERTPEISEAS